MKLFALGTLKAITIAATLACGVVAVGYSAEAAGQKVITPEADKWIAIDPELGNNGLTFSIVFGRPWMKGQPFGGLFKVPAGGKSKLHTHTSDYWAVMISGTEMVRTAVGMPISVSPQSRWFQPAKIPHVNECMRPDDCVFFAYFPRGMDYKPTAITK